jgi:hypothetical protein
VNLTPFSADPVFCGSNGRAMIGRASDLSAAAQTDSKGVLHILMIRGNSN